jgi:hypothetical protein
MDAATIGSVEGVLHRVRGTGGSCGFHVTERVNGRDLPCLVPTHLRQLAIAALGRRVIARGMISRFGDGRARHIELWEIESMAADGALPTVGHVAGLLNGYGLAD